MRHWRLILTSIFIVAILTASSLAAIRTVTYYSELYTTQTEPVTGQQGKFVDWTSNHSLKYFDPDMGRLISVDFEATLNGSLNAKAENIASDPVLAAYAKVDTDMNVTMINGDLLPLNVLLRYPRTTTVSVSAFDGTEDFAGPDSFNGTDPATGGNRNVSGCISYSDSADIAKYIYNGTGDTEFKLRTKTHGESEVLGGGTWNSQLRTAAFSYARITYTYDDARCLSGYKKDNCTGLPLSGWKIVVSNGSYEWNTTTDSNGFWRICQLENDTYTVCEVPQSGWVQTSSPPFYYPVTLAGINITNLNFSNQKTYCISGYKMEACYNIPIPGWNITLQNATSVTIPN